MRVRRCRLGHGHIPNGAFTNPPNTSWRTPERAASFKPVARPMPSAYMRVARASGSRPKDKSIDRHQIGAAIVVASCHLVCVLLSTLWSWSGLAGDNQPPRVLIISGFGDTLPAAGVARGAITKRLHETLHGKLEVFYDPLDFGRFPGQDYQDQITLFLAQKYAKKRPDVLIALELEIFALSVAHSRGDRTGSSHCLLLHVDCCSYFGNRLALARSNGRSQRERLDTNSCSCSSPSAQRS